MKKDIPPTSADETEEDGRTVSVTEIRPHGSMSIGKGIDDDGHCVTFAAEGRYGFEIAEALDATGHAVAFIPDHMILSDSGPAFESVNDQDAA